MLPESERALHQQRVARARHEGAIEALRSAAEHVRIGAAVSSIPAEIRPAIEAWLCRLAEQRLDSARKEAVRRMADEAPQQS
jgi:hypothetical protein